MSFPTDYAKRRQAGTGERCTAPPVRLRPLRWLPGLLCLLPHLLPPSAHAAPVTAPGEPVPRREIVQQGAQPKARWKSLWDEARVQARAGRPAAAAGLYEEVLRLKPENEAARWELARIWLLLKKPAQALSHLERLVEMAPANGEYRVALAAVLLQRGQYGRSAELFARVLEAEPGNIPALKGIATGLAAQGKRSEALPYLERWYAVEPAAAGLRRMLADAYYEQGLFEKARPFVADMAAGSRDKEVLKRAAVTHARLGQNSQAAEYWKKVLRQEPANKEARVFLAEYYEKEGQGEEALAFLRPRLEQEPQNPVLLRRIAQLYLNMAQSARALPYLERYVELKPGDHEALRQVVDIHAGLGNRAEALAGLERLLAAEPQPDLAKLKQAAYLYEAQGQLERALPLYERIIESTPDDPEILSRLAQALVAVGDDQAALAVWEHLGKRQKLIEALEGLHGHEPANRLVMLKLATMYLAKDALEKSRQMFDKLAAAGEQSPNFFAARASYYERSGQLDHALTDYEAALQSWPDRHELRLRCLRLAGLLGYAERVVVHAEALVAAERRGERVPPFLLTTANGYRDAGLWQKAANWYEEALARSSAPRERAEVRLELARLHEEAGRRYEAEQAARQAVLENPDSMDAYLELFDLALQRRAFQDAEAWLSHLAALNRLGAEMVGQPGEAARAAAVRVEELRARLLAAQGDAKAAARGFRAMLAGLPAPPAGEPSRQSRLHRDLIVLLGRSLLAAGKAAEAEEVLRPEWAATRENLAAAVLLMEVYGTMGRGEEARRVFVEARETAQQDAARLLELVRLCRQESRFAEVLTLAWAQPELLARSLAVQRAVVEAAVERGEQEEALTLLTELGARYPEEPDLALRRSAVLLQRGRLAEAAQTLEALPPEVRRQHEARLLRARIQWTAGERQAALQTLKEAMDPSVDAELAAAGQAQGVAMPVIEPASLWSRLVAGGEEPLPVAAAAMAPQRLAAEAPLAKSVSRVATPFYAGSQWQRQLQAEFEAKGAVERREYFAAAKEYEKLVRDYPADGSVLYDLAGIYSKLDQPLEEAALYETLRARGEEYPGLAVAAERNRLRRRPQSSVAYGSSREEGWGGYKAIQQDEVVARHRQALALQQEVSASLARVEYQATDRDATVRANRAEAGYARRLFSGLTLTAGGGVSALEEGEDTLLAQVSVAGDLGDRLWSRLAFRRDVVEDTVASLTRAIVQEAVSAEMGLDLLPRLQVGGGYGYTGYSDNNWTQGYDLWASYILITDPTLLKLSYTYDFKDSMEAPQLGSLLPDGFAAGDHPYWAPRSYWQKRLNVFFRHQLGDDPYGREAQRYYTASYTMIYDSRGYPQQSWEGSFFVEWRPDFLLEASAEVTTGQEYRSRTLFLSLTHRW